MTRVIVAFAAICGLALLAGCKGEEEVGYGGEVRTNTAAADQMKTGGVSKPMVNTPSID